MDYADIAKSAMEGLQVHRQAIFTAVLKNLEASKFESPELIVEAPAGFVLKDASAAPPITKGMPSQDAEMLEELIKGVVASAEAMAAADIERMVESFKDAVKLPSIAETRKAAERGELKMKIDNVPVWGRQ
jgi:hypothetical protein